MICLVERDMTCLPMPCTLRPELVYTLGATLLRAMWIWHKTWNINASRTQDMGLQMWIKMGIQMALVCLPAWRDIVRTWDGGVV